ncbi:MAG: hypothetical protein ASARMPRED_009150 [Alectoria sarmentosa]|nr:MAG: hypothetical protein ASARMPRED_009150 [Alectoria sarmentosa]
MSTLITKAEETLAQAKQLDAHIVSNGLPPTSCQVAHTAISHALSTGSEFFEAVGLLTDEFTPASSALIGAIDTYPDSEEPTYTGYNLAN